MSVYKPTNCHPYAGAVDITDAFLKVENNGAKIPEPLYAVCKIQTNNVQVTGYRMHLYADGREVFSGEHFSPISELPKFEDDATVNSGAPGTYLAIPFIQTGSGVYDSSDGTRLLDEQDLVIRSCNGVYLNVQGYGDTVGAPMTRPNMKADFLVSLMSESEGADKTDFWEIGNIIRNTEDEIISVVISHDSPWDGTLNGGCFVGPEDIVAFEFADPDDEEEHYLAFVTFHGGIEYGANCITVVRSQLGDAGQSYFLRVEKGNLAGMYNILLTSASGSAVQISQDWDAKLFYLGDSGFVYLNGAGSFSTAQLSWSIDLLQGDPAKEKIINSTFYDYIDLDHDGELTAKRFYDMKMASGTILGSNSTRLHLGSIEESGEQFLPGKNMQTEPVLVGTFCELFYDDANRLTPSFPVASFDSSLGLVYPKEGYLTQSVLERYRGQNPGQTLKARFYKYSSNAADTLSDESVRACFSTPDGVGSDIEGADGINPQEYLKPGALVDGVVLSAGDRVLWNSLYDLGHANGIWVVGQSVSDLSRPADGDSWSDYIGKVVLVREGEKMASRVMESTAVGGSYQLGENALFFREQTPVPLFNFASETENSVDEAIPGIKPEQYIQAPVFEDYDGSAQNYHFTDPSTGTGYTVIYYPSYQRISQGAVGLPLPCGNDTESALLSFNYNDTTQIILPSNRHRHARNAVISNSYLEIMTTPTGTVPSGGNWQFICSYPYRTGVASVTGHVRNGNTPYVTITYSYSRAGVFARVLDAETASYDTYRVLKGVYANLLMTRALTQKKINWDISPKEISAEVLFNTKTVTYVSPAPAVSDHMFLHFRNGATADHIEMPGYNHVYLEYLPIGDFDHTFNRFRHSELSVPLVSSKNDSATPPTPYKYDIVSRYRASDANGFVLLPKILLDVYPTPEKFEEDDRRVYFTSYEADLSGKIFSPVGTSWSEARWVLSYPDDETRKQDTGWFSEGSAACRFVGLEPGTEYPVVFQAKDEYGRISSKSFTIISQEANALPFPGTLTAELDEQTHSILVNYYPEGGEDAPILGGSYDLYKREFANFHIEGCHYHGWEDYTESQWYGPWTPVALGVKEKAIRDFNVKQGHSYQYAIFPHNGAPVVEYKVYVGTEEPTEYAGAAFDDGRPMGAQALFLVGVPDEDISTGVLVDPGTEDNCLSTDWAEIGDWYYYIGESEFQDKQYWLWKQHEAYRDAETDEIRHRLTDNYILTSGASPANGTLCRRLFANDSAPVYVQWSDWSLVELTEKSADEYAGEDCQLPAVKKVYEADVDKLWLFKYDVDEGAQTMNIAKSEFNSLGEFPRYFGGNLNAESGEISCWLGSEIAPGSRLGYTERRHDALFAPTSTNEAAALLADWRKIVKSDNPKLLRDRKGRSWIVQICGGSSATEGSYSGRPTKITFSWKQIGDPDKDTVIFGSGKTMDETGKSGVWKPNIICNANGRGGR